MMYSSKQLVLATLIGALLAGCGEKKSGEAAAAKVNGTAISAAEVDMKMKQYSHFPEQQKQRVAGTILKATIDSELLRQAAVKEKLDQDESVRLQLLQANRLILANAYVEKRRSEVAKPTAAEVKAYYDQHPALYADRKLFELRELVIQPKPANEAEILAKLGDGKKFDEFARWLTERKIPHGIRSQSVVPDNMPADIPPKLNKLGVGEAIAISNPDLLSVLRVDALQPQPVTLEKATPGIEIKLLEERRMAAMKDAFKKLREKAKIEYVAPYGENSTATLPGH